MPVIDWKRGGLGGRSPPSKTNMCHYQRMPVRGVVEVKQNQHVPLSKHASFGVFYAQDFANTTWAFATADELDESLFAALAKPAAFGPDVPK